MSATVYILESEDGNDDVDFESVPQRAYTHRLPGIGWFPRVLTVVVVISFGPVRHSGSLLLYI